MNWVQISGDWKRYRGKVREKWGFLSDEDLDAIDGKRDILIGRLEARYGVTKLQAERWIDDFGQEMDKAA